MFPGWHDMACKLACSDLRTYGGGRSCCFLLGNSYGNVSSHRIEDPPQTPQCCRGRRAPASSRHRDGSEPPRGVTPAARGTASLVRPQKEDAEPEVLPAAAVSEPSPRLPTCTSETACPGRPRRSPRSALCLQATCADRDSVWKEPPVRLTVEKNPAASPDVSTCGVRVRVPRHLSVPGCRCPSGQPFTTRLLARV